MPRNNVGAMVDIEYLKKQPKEIRQELKTLSRGSHAQQRLSEEQTGRVGDQPASEPALTKSLLSRKLKLSYRQENGQ